MIGRFHVDKVDDDDAAEISEAQLARDDLRRLQIGLEDRIVEVAVAHVAAGIDVDRGHRLGLVENEVAAALQFHPPRERPLDLVLDVVEIEERPLAGVVLELREHRGGVLGGELLELLEVLARVDQDSAGVLARDIAQHSLRERQVLVEQGRRGRGEGAPANAVPELPQVLDVRAQLRVGGGVCNGANDESAGLVGGQELLQLVSQQLTLGLVLDALRDADVRVLRQVYHQPSGDRDLGGKARALGADGILDHLHQPRLAFGEDFLDRFAARVVRLRPLFPDVGDVQEPGALQADFDERRLHAGQHPRHAPDVDVAHQTPVRRALDVQLLRHARLHHADAGFLRRAVDQDVLRHDARSRTS